MSETKTKYTTFNQYFDDFPEGVQTILQEIRRTIQEVAPTATEAISYNMPAFKLHGKNLVYFAAHKAHIGMYPMPSTLEALADDLVLYTSGKGTVQFPLNQPMPLELIRKIVEFRVNAVSQAAAKKR